MRVPGKRAVSSDQRETGYGLIEVLVALAILGLAASGGIHVIVGSLQRQAVEAVERDALNALRRPFELGEVAQGEVLLRDGRVTAHWSVTHGQAREGQLAGVPARWVTIIAVIEWDAFGQTRQRQLMRTEIHPMPATR